MGENLSGILRDTLSVDENFHDALGIIKQNCQGRIWLIGGYLYKNQVKF